MNILITLPGELIAKILTGKKKFEMRKCIPERMEVGFDGFFVVEKGTNKIRCWCRVDKIIDTGDDIYSSSKLAQMVCVPEKYIERYNNGKALYLWKIGKVIKIECLCRESLCVDRNPQQFAYCPLSYGESY